MNLIDLADGLFSKLARRSRADDTGMVVCVCCGKPFHWASVDCAHFVVRGNLALRYDLNNCWPVCRFCHSLPTHSSDYEAALVKEFGQGFVDDLRARGYRYSKAPSEGEKEELVARLIEELKKYGYQQGTWQTDFPHGYAALQGGKT